MAIRATNGAKAALSEARADVQALGAAAGSAHPHLTAAGTATSQLGSHASSAGAHLQTASTHTKALGDAASGAKGHMASFGDTIKGLGSHLGTIAPQFSTTDATGAYDFANLRPGVYTVTEPQQPAGYLDGQDSRGNVTP